MTGIRTRLLRRLAPPIHDLVGERTFDVYVREGSARREFFFNAFKALRFNGIEGEGKWEWVPYVQFGWSGMSFALEDRALSAS